LAFTVPQPALCFTPGCLGVRHCALQLLLLHRHLLLLRCRVRALAAVGELHLRQVCLHLRTHTYTEQEGDA
jgi:hypothetical protein